VLSTIDNKLLSLSRYHELLSSLEERLENSIRIMKVVMDNID
jgi:hypothetical protein